MAKKPKVLPPIEWLEPRVRLMRVISLVCFFGLIGLLCAYYLIFADLHGARPWVILLIELVPLMFVVPGMLMGSPRGHSFTCYVVNLYLIKGRWRHSTPTARSSACWKSPPAWRCLSVPCCLCAGATSWIGA